MNEKEFLNICSSVLNKSVSLNDNFFKLGGTSLLILPLMKKINQHYSINLSFSDIITTIMNTKSTMKDMLSLIDSKLDNSSNNINEIIHISNVDKFPLTYSQYGFWLGSKNNSIRENVLDIFKLKDISNFNLETLKSAIILAAKKNPEMTINIYEENYTPYMKYGGKIFLDVVRFNDGESLQFMISKLKNQEENYCFNLEKDSLFRFIIGISKENVILVFNSHHTICDAMSVNNIISEIENIYNTLSQNKKVSTLPKDIQYTDFTTWQLSLLDKGLLKDELEFWKNKLQEPIQQINLSEVSICDWNDSNGCIYNFNFSKEDTLSKLQSLCNEKNISMYNGIMSLIVTWIYCLTGYTDISFGTSFAMRVNSKLINMIGNFAITQLFRVNIKEDFTFYDILNETYTTSTNMRKYSCLPYEKVSELLSVPHKYFYLPYRVLVIYIENDNLNNLFEHIDLEKDTDNIMVQADMIFAIINNNNNISISIRYKRSLFTLNDIKDLFNIFDKSSQYILDLDKSLKDIDQLI